MENKQTAVEWLYEQFEAGDMWNLEDAQRIKHQALEMEKQQITDAWSQAIWTAYNSTPELYYNNTYRNGKETDSN